jgi:hypothetical protein
MSSYIPILIGLLIIGGVLYWYFRVKADEDPNRTVILDDSLLGKTNRDYLPLLPLSTNQPEGIVYTYTAWILIKDFTVGYGERRRIFSKNDSPGLYIDSTSNALIASVATYGAVETILIPNIPANKWLHFAMVVNQYSVQIYINGILRQYHTLGQLPKQNTDVVKIGSTWEGVLGNLHYYSRALAPSEVDALSREEVPSDLGQTPAAPQYFDITWYIGRLNPTR